MSQVFLVKLTGQTKSSFQVFAASDYDTKEGGIEFKGQLLTTTEQQEVDESLVFKLDNVSVKLFVPWHRVVEIRNLSFEKKVRG